MQVDKPGPRQGCFTWYWGELEPVDTNAAFFIAQSLIVLHRCYADQLDAPCRTLLDEMLAGLRRWFSMCLPERMFYYPNKFLGDLVCGWLLHEEIDDAAALEAFAGVMRDAAEYWHHHGWGWGEHMSDVYAHVCLDELSLLLLLARRLPAPLREQYHDLFRELLAIEDQFDGIPRVPALRSYAFSASPTHGNYRDSIAPLPVGLSLHELGNQPRLGPIFQQLGWERLATPRASRQQDVAIPCFDGAVARAHLEDDIILGGMSRFPLMPSADHPTWGLSWQCFPAACWRPAGDWGFLQWSVIEDGITRCHPSAEQHNAYLYNALTGQVLPPTVGRTWCLPGEGSCSRCASCRCCRGHGTRWPIACACSPCTRKSSSARKAMAGRRWRSITRNARSEWHAVRSPVRRCRSSRGRATGSTGSSDYAKDVLAGRRLYMTLWGISLHGPIVNAPQLAPAAASSVPRTPEERAWRLQWAWPAAQWEVNIDPLAAVPLVE